MTAVYTRDMTETRSQRIEKLATALQQAEKTGNDWWTAIARRNHQRELDDAAWTRIANR